jgi:RimJ/RimL family protein N-acetyltransferase
VIDRLPHRTDRLVLRTLRTDDLEAFLAFRSREDVARLQGWVPMSREDALAFLRLEGTDAPLAPGTWRQIGIADASDDVLLGDLGVRLSDDGTTVEIGISMHPDHQGLGLGTEATRALVELLFGHTPARRVVALTDARNEGAIRSLGKVGMRRVSARSAEFKGETCVEYEFAIDRDAGR